MTRLEVSPKQKESAGMNKSLLLSVFVCFAAIEPIYAQTADLTGDWICTEGCQPIGGKPIIKQSGKRLALTNEKGDACVGGFWLDDDENQMPELEWWCESLC
jgi:hypothetical protein